MGRNWISVAALLVLGGCSAGDSRCAATPNPRECARVIRAGGQFEDYRRNGLGSYSLSAFDPPRLYRSGSMTVGRIASYETAISRLESREIRRRNARFRRDTRRAVRANRDYRAARAARHH